MRNNDEMMTVNTCTHCLFYTGEIDSYTPECNCPLTKVNQTSDAEIQQIDFSLAQDHLAQKAKRMNRRRADKKHAKKAVKSLAITNAKLNRLPTSAAADDFVVANKKCYNTSKEAKYSYITNIQIPSSTLLSMHLVCNIDYLIHHLWVGSEKEYMDALNRLETAKQYGGNVVGLHREENVLHLTIGFLSKTALSEFLWKTA